MTYEDFIWSEGGQDADVEQDVALGKQPRERTNFARTLGLNENSDETTGASMNSSREKTGWPDPRLAALLDRA
jgi:hypothetical protein